jgi:hypothetical protein
VRMYETMIKLQTVDTIFYEAQRQVGRACELIAWSKAVAAISRTTLPSDVRPYCRRLAC